jgi:putative glutamine amidotransferase
MLPLVGISCMSEDPTETLDVRHSARLAYVNAVALAGAAPVLIPMSDIDESLETICSRLDGLMLTGGGDIDPELYGEGATTQLISPDRLRDRTEIWLAKQAISNDMPLLGICRGLQVLNVACGGSLHQDIAGQVPHAGQHRFAPPDHGREYLAHVVEVQADTLLANLIQGAEKVHASSTLRVNSRHHQAIKEVGYGLSVVARARDGIVEAIEGPGRRFMLGVQWHPEDLVARDEAARRMFEAFIRAADSYRIDR